MQMRNAADRMRHAIDRLGPYPSLALLAVPVVLVEPLKLVAVAIAGEGHWITGTAMMLGAYAFSLLVVERLFMRLKPKLLKLSWFAKGWAWLVIVRARILARWAPPRKRVAVPTSPRDLALARRERATASMAERQRAQSTMASMKMRA